MHQMKHYKGIINRDFCADLWVLQANITAACEIIY